ncbi:TPA: DUF262 domain-containing protein [Pseudomonas aeruginosa]|nr:DUF262 domain-containing protein [Pseudomonas aeruginosa]HCK4590440.1 DUF262 domain-containing protein [Pseudomonas aeruginosa]
MSNDQDVDQDVDYGVPASEPQGLLTLEDKYKDQMRQIYPTKIDLPLITLLTQIDQQINLRPDFQRRDRWTNEKRSRFIESIIMNVPIPPVFLGEETYGQYVVLDGRQRLTSAYRFLNNELKLEGLKVWTELNGLFYSDLEAQGLAVTIQRRFLPAILLTKESSPEVKYEVFDRLNTGGVKAEPMEVRNAIFPGPFTDKLQQWSRLPLFREMWGIPTQEDQAALESNTLYRDMSDVELVLRFFALQGATLDGMRFKDKLSEYMYQKNKEYLADTAAFEADEAKFLLALDNCQTIFGLDCFKKPESEEKFGRRSAPYADAVMYALSKHSREVTIEKRSEIREALISLAIKNRTFRNSVSTGTNGESATRNRMELADAVVSSAISGA